MNEIINKTSNEVLQQESYLAPKVNDIFKNATFGEDRKDSFNWSNMFRFDTDQGKDFLEGFKDENFIAMVANHYINPPKQFHVDESYNVTDDMDEQHRYFYQQDKDYYGQAHSSEQFDYLIQKRKEQINKISSMPSYIAGRIVGGLTDATNIFLMSRGARGIYASGRIARTTKTTSILGVEEMGKQYINPERTKEEAYMILGGNALLNMLLPSFKGMTKTDKDSMKSYIHAMDINDQKTLLLNANGVKIKVGPTLKYRDKNGKAVYLSTAEHKAILVKGKNKTDLEEIGAYFTIEGDQLVIRINPKKLKLDFKNKAWTKPKIKGVNPIPANKFKTYEEYEEFVLNHEKAHTYIKRKKNETTADYENRINEWSISPNRSTPKSQYNDKDYINNKIKMMNEIDDERFVETFLGKLGEESNWNPINRLVNIGNLTAIKYAKQIANSVLYTKGNMKGNPNVQSLEHWFKADNQQFGYTVLHMKEEYNLYKQTVKNPITQKEFNQRVSRALIDSTYVDSIPQVMKAKTFARKYYDYVGKKIKDSNVRVNEQEIVVGMLNNILKNTKGNEIQVIRHMRDGTKTLLTYTKKEFQEIIKKETKFLEQLKKNPLRENYLNRFVNRGKINNNVEAWRSFATKSLARTNPTFTSKQIDDLVRSYEESFPWQKFDNFDAKKTDLDVNIEKYFFNPAGTSGNLKKRGNFILDEIEWQQAGYLENDIFSLMQVYHKSVLPDTYLASIFGTANTYGGGFFKGKGYQAGLRDVAEEYSKKYNKAKNAKERAAIVKERDEVLKDMEATRDMFKGTYGVPPDPSNYFSSGIRLMKQFNAWTSLQGAMASIVDIGRSVFYNGMQRSLKTTWEGYQSGLGKEIYKISLKEARMSGEGFDMLLSTRALAYNDLDNIYGALSKIERGANKVTGVFFMANLMSPWNQMIKTHNTMMIVTRILEESENLVNGTITQLNKAKLAQSGIGYDDAVRIIQSYKNHGQGIGSLRNDVNLKEIRLAKSFDWLDEEIAKKFQLAVQNDVNISIITPGLMDTPLWMSTELGGLVAQFKKFSMGMTNRFLIRGLQEKDASFLGTIMLMVALGGIIDAVRSRAFDMDYKNKSNLDKFKGAFERSGVGGVFTDVYNMTERVMFDDVGGKVGAVVGPTGSQMDKVQQILTNDNPSVQAMNVRRITPFQNIWYLDSLFDQMEKGIQ